MDNSKIINLIQGFDKYKVLIIGDVMIDSYMWGKVERISPEAPVPVLTSQNRENRLGGAANVALNILSLGATPILCSVIGDDEHGVLFKELMKEKNLVTEGLLVDTDRKTTIKTRVISEHQHLLRIDEEDSMNLSAIMEDAFVKHMLSIICKKQVDAIIFEDYDKGVITPLVIENIVAMANKMGIPTLVDPKKRNFSAYKNVTLFKPNFKELSEGLKMDLRKNDPENIHSATERLHKDLHINYVMVTLSEMGVLISEDGTYKAIPAHKRDITDVSGAGDTVISTASLCMISGMSPEQIACISNLAGGIVCEKTGVVPIEKEQLIEEVKKLK